MVGKRLVEIGKGQSKREAERTAEVRDRREGVSRGTLLKEDSWDLITDQTYKHTYTYTDTHTHIEKHA